MNPPINQNILRAYYLFSAIAIVASVFMVARSFSDYRNTGLLSVGSDSPGALLSVSQPGKQALPFGSGAATVRLKPGRYLLSASSGGKEAALVVNIQKRRNVKVVLRLTSSGLPSVKNISFKYFDALIDTGLTTDQVNDLKTKLFQFKPNSQHIELKVNSIYREPHNPNVDTSFKIDFATTIDDMEYKAVIDYSDLSTVHVVLYNPVGQVMFDSSNQQAE